MNRYLTILPIPVAVVILGIGAYVQGKYTERWDSSHTEKLMNFTERLKHVPMTVGPWEGKVTEVDKRQIERSGSTGVVSRVYTHQETHQEVSVFLVCGTAHHVTVHTPDWCYRGAGFKMQGEPSPYTIECEPVDPVPQFSTTTFLKEDPTGATRLRIFWSFSDDGKWEGPTWPKPYFAGRPALYKIYLITAATGKEGPTSQSASIEFAKLFMPMLNDVLFTEEELAAKGT